MNLASEREMSETMPIVIVMIALVVLFGALGLAYERQKRDERRQGRKAPVRTIGRKRAPFCVIRFPGRFGQACAGVPYGSSARRALGPRRRRRLPSG